MSLTKTKPTSGISTPTSSPEGGSSCVIAGGTKIEGNFQSAENVRLDGTIVGDFSCDKKLVVGKEGTVDGNIRARDAVILGTVKGDMTISGLLHLERSAHITGNITTGSLNVEEGARYDGHCKVG
ncbi:MAG: polymer-forming cytoskeletal protein [Lewinellaceae bacterium]|nr:polymer-forming cytoskeletal protein [Lewinellaceae bacterium]